MRRHLPSGVEFIVGVGAHVARIAEQVAAALVLQMVCHLHPVVSFAPEALDVEAILQDLNKGIKKRLSEMTLVQVGRGAVAGRDNDNTVLVQMLK